jgi:type II secretion system protein E
VAHGVVRQDELLEAMASCGDDSRRLGQTLVSQGRCTSAEIASALAEQFGLPFQSLRDVRIDPGAARKIPAELALRHHILPLGVRGDALIVAVADPNDLYALDDIQRTAGQRIRPVVADAEELRRLVEEYYLHHSIRESPEAVEEGLEVVVDKEDDLDVAQEMFGQAVIISFVNRLIRQAIAERASDIHIEPFENEVRIRLRVDGVLRKTPSQAKMLHAAIVSRIKIMSELDIAEHRLPQDGRIKVRAAGREVDVRISTLPTLYGESVVMRLLDHDPRALQLTNLGFPKDTFERFRRLLQAPYGIILATGPTGSGKSTTLYAALQNVSGPERKVITIEDPVEYRLPGVNQMHVRPKIGLTFAEGLRHILRQDPDVIMVGEIRDPETADIAINAALTGHLVFSTLHTNDSAGAVARLLDMGIEPFQVASSVEGIVAQRLVRRLCPHCREAATPLPAEQAELTGAIGHRHDGPIYRATGCAECRGTGYRGRIGLYELMILDDAIANLVLRRAATREIKEFAQSRGMVTLRDAGWRKVSEGITTVEEVTRVTHEDEARNAVGEDEAPAA